MRKVIETYDDLLDWSKRANLSLTLADKIKLQDEFGHSEDRVIKKLWEQSVGCSEQNLIIFSLQKVMGSDYLRQYVNVWVRTEMDKRNTKANNAYELRWKTLHFKEEDLKTAKKTVAKRIRKIEHTVRQRDIRIFNQNREIRNLLDDNKKLRNSLGGAMDQASKYEHYADQYFDMLNVLIVLQENMEKKKLGVLK